MLLLLVVVIELVRRSGATALLAACFLLPGCAPARDDASGQIELVEGATLSREGAFEPGKTQDLEWQGCWWHVTATRARDGLHVTRRFHRPPFMDETELWLTLDAKGRTRLRVAVETWEVPSRTVWRGRDYEGRVALDRTFAAWLQDAHEDELLIDYDLDFVQSGSEGASSGRIHLPQGWSRREPAQASADEGR